MNYLPAGETLWTQNKLNPLLQFMQQGVFPLESEYFCHLYCL